MYTILTLWSQLQNKRVHALPLICIYHTDSVESTSKFFFVSHRFARRYTILTLWSQLQNEKRTLKTVLYLYHTDSVESTSKCMRLRADLDILYHTDSVESTSKSWTSGSRSCWSIPYWLCGVNFKISVGDGYPQQLLYHTDSVESTSKCCMLHQMAAAGLYHTDSVESTSKWVAEAGWAVCAYTILTLWSQLQNGTAFAGAEHSAIPYWLCGVNFKMEDHSSGSLSRYTILTLWSQLQNTSSHCESVVTLIPYWLCGVNFKINSPPSPHPAHLYHTDSVESTSK